MSVSDRLFRERVLHDSYESLAGSTEQQLIRKLLQYYEPSVRPVIRAQAIVTISFRMEITQLFELVRHSRVTRNSFFSPTLIDLGRENTDLNDQCAHRTEMDR